MREAESSYEPGCSDVVHGFLREPAMFQIGLQGKVLRFYAFGLDLSLLVSGAFEGGGLTEGGGDSTPP